MFFFLFQARFGFNPTDDGFMLSQAWRISHGELPHVDFASPRPLGSALLHLPGVLLQSHMLAFSRLVVLLQLLWVAFALVDSFSRLSQPISAVAKFGLVTLSFMVNLGTWPVMAWHTIDGIFLGVTALWLATLRHQKTYAVTFQWVAVWLVSGFAVLMKQPFALVPFLAALLITARSWKHAAITAPIILVPGVLYYIAFGGLSGELVLQLYGGNRQELFGPFQSLMAILFTLQGMLGVVLVCVSAVLTRLLRGKNSWWHLAPLAIPGAFGLTMAHLEEMSIVGLWPFTITAMFVASIVLANRNMRQYLFAAAALGLGFSASLSWGAPAPSLLAGSYLALTVYILWNLNQAWHPQHRNKILTGAVAFLGLTAVFVSSAAREQNVFRELPRAELISEVNHPNFAWIRVSPQSASYVESIMFCVDTYKTKSVTIIPDNAGLYPLLGLRNSFPVDWWLTLEQPPDHSKRVQETVAKLNQEQNYVVLFQTYDAAKLRDLQLNEVRKTGEIFVSNPDDSAILDSLRGRPIACASFLGKFSSEH